MSIAKSPAIAVVEPAHSLGEGVISSEVRLLAFDLPRNLVNPGDDLEVALYWEALQDISGDYVVVVQLSDAQGRAWAQEQSRPVYGDYPATDQEKGKVIRDWQEAIVDRQTPSASQQLSVGLSGGRQPLGQVDLGAVSLSGRSRSYEVPTMEHRLDLRLGDGALLLGYDLVDSVEAGQPIRLTLHWQCLAEMTTSYTVFSHVVDDGNAVRGRVDSPPARSEAPTTSWVEGEVRTDPYEIALEPEAREGEYAVELGPYDAASMERLPRCDAQGALRGDTILLKGGNVALQTRVLACDGRPCSCP